MTDRNADFDGSLASYLAEHPRLIGALFTMVLLLSQAGSAAAGCNVGSGTCGT